MKHPHGSFGGRRGITHQLYLPCADVSISPVLFNYPWTCWEKLGKALDQLVGSVIQARIRPPPEVARTVEDFLCAHFQNNVRMCANPHALRRYFPKNRIQLGPVLASHNRIHPNEDAVQIHQLFTNLVNGVIRIHYRFPSYLTGF
jgi:hypothetical protein